MSGRLLVLYQAGADPHVNDPLGGFLTTEEMMREALSSTLPLVPAGPPARAW